MRLGVLRRCGGWLGLLALAACWCSSTAQADVYWPNSGAGSLGRAGLDGSAVNQTFVADPFSQPFGVAVDAGHIYWTNGSLIGRANLDGSAVDGSFISGSAVTNANGIAVSASHIYWTELGRSPQIEEANLDGSNVQSVPVAGLGEPFALAVDGTYLYWADVGNNAIGRAPLATPAASNPTFITGFTDAPKGVAVDGSHIYWSDQAGTIGRANLDGSGANDSFITGAQSPQGVALDTNYVYWANATSNTIARAPLSNPTLANENFITGASAPFAVAVDSGAAPVSAQAPSVTGLAVGGATLTEQHGTWTGSPTSFAVQWLSCDQAGAHCVPVTGATAATYAVGPSDVGSTIRAQETATNTFGSSQVAVSAASAVIQPAGPFLIGAIRTVGPAASLTIGCHGPASCQGRVILTVREHTRAGRVIAVTARRPKPAKISTVAIGQATFTVAVGHSATVRLTLNGVGKRLLASFYTINVDASFRVTPIPDRTLTFAYPLLVPRVGYTALPSTTTSFAAFSIARLGIPVTVRVTCRGAGCPFSHRQRTVRTRSVNLEPWLSGAHLAPGATLQLAVTAPNHVGSVVSLRMRSGRAPIETDLCLAPGSRTPQRCR